ncbi:MAG: TetR/AcrR family transcriptional regulator [bacterium]|nr:TetR/AcrR family transcriptional regulator [bacterium]
MTSRQKQAIATKLKILEVASELFRDRGYDTVKVTDICKDANISVGAFYHHFKSKEDIINQGYREVDLLLQERLEDLTFSSARDGIYKIFDEYCSILDELGHNFVTMSYRLFIGKRSSFLLSRDRYLHKIMIDVISDGLDKGEIVSRFSKEETYDILFRFFRGDLFNWCLHNGTYSLKEIFFRDLDLFFSHSKDDLYLE